MKTLLLPLNILTLGLFSTVVYVIVFNYLVVHFGLVSVNSFTTVIIAALTYALIINLLEKLL